MPTNGFSFDFTFLITYIMKDSKARYASKSRYSSFPSSIFTTFYILFQDAYDYHTQHMRGPVGAGRVLSAIYYAYIKMAAHYAHSCL